KAAVFSFSRVPLSFFYLTSVLGLAVFLGAGAYAIFHKLFTGLAIPGWTSLLLASSFFGSLNALGIAVLGEYVTRIFDQVRGRPLFIVARGVNLAREATEARRARSA